MIQLQPATNGYDEGLSTGKGAAGNWQPGATTLLEKWCEALTEAPNRNVGHLDPSKGLEIFGALNREDLLARSAALHSQKMAAFPDLERFPEVAGLDQYLDEYPRGFADGAGIDVREVYLSYYWKEMFFDYLAPRGSGHWQACSECYLPETPDGPLLGNGRDDIMIWYTDEPFGHSWPPVYKAPENGQVNQISPQEEGRGYRSFGGVNEVGLCLETGGGAMYEYEENREEVQFPAPVLDLVLRTCSSTLEAVEMLIRYNLHWGPCNCVVGDAAGLGAVIEKSKYHYAVKHTDRSVVVSTYGGCDDEDMRRLCDTKNPYFRYYERRLAVMKEILMEAETNGCLGVDAFWRSMLHHDPQAGGCQHRDTMPEGVELFTHCAAATLPAEGRQLNRRIARHNGSVRYPCDVPPQEVRFQFT